jgi:hypothetical protein
VFQKWESSLNQSAEDTPTGWQTNLLSWCLKTIAASYILIVLSVLICLVLSLRHLQGPPVYKVEALLIQNNDPASSLRSAGSQSPLSAVLGVGGPASMPEIDEFQILLSSPVIATILDNKYHFLRDIYRDNWDAKNNRWYPHHPGVVERVHTWFVEAVSGIPGWHDPNSYDLASFLGSAVTVNRTFYGSVMSVSMNTDRPEDAKRWINNIIYEVSDIIRSQMIDERQNYTNYLLQQMNQSTLTTSRDATISILADQFRALMVLKSAKTFPLQIIQPPTRGQYPVNKSVSLFLMIGVLSGLMVAGILIALGVRDATLGQLFSRFLSYVRRR